MKPHEIERHQAQPQQVEIVLHLDPSLFWFCGHFAVQPLLPGVAQMDWVMHYATTLLARLALSQHSEREISGSAVTGKHRHASPELARRAPDTDLQLPAPRRRSAPYRQQREDPVMPLTFSPCVLIPCYNHGAMMASVLARLQPFGLPCIVVDDGSDDATRDELARPAAEDKNLTLIRLPINSGKGAATICGMQAAAEAGFSHAVQVDADGQHAIEDIPKLLALAELHPTALISGQPIYDDSIPARACTDAG